MKDDCFNNVAWEMYSLCWDSQCLISRKDAALAEKSRENGMLLHKIVCAVS